MVRRRALLSRIFGEKTEWSLVIPLATLAIYGSSYLFQAGYNLVYDIPPSLISLDLAKIAFSLILLLIVCAVNLIGIELIYNLAQYDSGKRSDRKRARVTLQLMNLALLVVIGLYAYEPSELRRALYILFTLICFIGLAVFCKFGSEKLVFLDLFKSRRSAPVVYRSFLGEYFSRPREIVLVTFMTIVLGLMITLVGSVCAGFQTSYLVEASNTKVVVLNTYGDKFITGRIAPDSNNLLTNEYAIVEPSQDGTFISKQIIQLRTQASETRREQQLNIWRWVEDSWKHIVLRQ